MKKEKECVKVQKNCILSREILIFHFLSFFPIWDFVYVRKKAINKLTYEKPLELPESIKNVSEHLFEMQQSKPV